jgi:hypothetical protein
VAGQQQLLSVPVEEEVPLVEIAVLFTLQLQYLAVAAQAAVLLLPVRGVQHLAVT